MNSTLSPPLDLGQTFNTTRFAHTHPPFSVRQIIDTVSFNKPHKVQVFESTIRILGSLLSAHQFASGEMPSQRNPRSVDTPSFKIEWYKGELLHMAVDLGDRLVKAWEVGGRGKKKVWGDIPYARVRLYCFLSFVLPRRLIEQKGGS